MWLYKLDILLNVLDNNVIESKFEDFVKRNNERIDILHKWSSFGSRRWNISVISIIV